LGIIGRGVELHALGEPTVLSQIEHDSTTLLRGQVIVDEIVERQLQPMPVRWTPRLEIHNHGPTIDSAKPVSRASCVEPG
tara:strand:- start:259 stop:498 length:240 start_codon:yes stop_codon:yes gene_type:complete